MNLLEDTAQRWSLDVAEPFAGLSYNFVAPALRGRARCVLKLGVPTAELRGEIEALWAFDGRGAVRLLEANPGAGALLLERVEPGTRLAELTDDDRATRVACKAMTRLWRPAPCQDEVSTLTRPRVLVHVLVLGGLGHRRPASQRVRFARRPAAASCHHSANQHREACGRQHGKHREHFMLIARGSAAECAALPQPPAAPDPKQHIVRVAQMPTRLCR